jgi:hypothetical protein
VERAKALVQARKKEKPSLFQRFTKRWTAKKPNNFYEHVGDDFYIAPVKRVDEEFTDPYGHKYSGSSKVKTSSKMTYWDEKSGTWKDVEDNNNGFRGHDYYGDGAYGDDYYGGGYGGGYGGYGGDYKHTPINYGPDKKSVKFLKQLLDKTGAKIVYSSTRRSSGWEHCAKYLGLPRRYSLGGKQGVTPDIPISFLSSVKDQTQLIYDDGTIGWKERQKEIRAWFKEWTGAKIANYVILDDDPISDPQMKLHWIPSISNNGFQEKEFKEALKILSKG